METVPGMLIDTCFTYSVRLSMHVSWRTRVAVSSCTVFLMLTVARVREQIVNELRMKIDAESRRAVVAKEIDVADMRFRR